MSNITVEYLIIVKASESFCKDVASFKRLVQVDPNIQIKKDTIAFGEEFNCSFSIFEGEISDKEQHYFQLKFIKLFSGDPTEEIIKAFSDALRTIRRAVSKMDGKMTVLHDDISRYYSIKSYPLIYETENLMRRLIRHFMLINVGAEWVSETLPDDLKATSEKIKRRTETDLLDSLDFCDLASYLLKPVSKSTPSEIYVKVQKASTVEDLNELKRLLPESNWQRHFAAIVECQDGQLRKKWDELYELRCIVAHNAPLKRDQYQRIQELTDELRDILEKALTKLPQVELSAVDKNLADRAKTQYLMSDAVVSAIERLPDREKLVMALYFYEGLTLKEIGRVLSVSVSRVRQLHTQAKLRVRGYLQRDRSAFSSFTDEENEADLD